MDISEFAGETRKRFKDGSGDGSGDGSALYVGWADGDSFGYVSCRGNGSAGDGSGRGSGSGLYSGLGFGAGTGAESRHVPDDECKGE